MRVIVTRPAAQAAEWVQRLQALGVAAVALPLIDIAAAEDPAALAAAWQRLPGAALAMFVSPNAVLHFFHARPAGAPWPPHTLAGSTGPGTSRALRAAGVPAAQLAEPAPEPGRFDSEALWARIAGRDWAGRRVLVVRGEDGRDWLAEQLRTAGAEVEFVAAYRRTAPRLDEPGAAVLAQALARPAEHLWLFSSSEAVGHLRGLAPRADWSAARAAASHPRIVRTAQEAGFGRVDAIAPQPEAVAAWVAADAAADSGASPASGGPYNPPRK